MGVDTFACEGGKTAIGVYVTQLLKRIPPLGLYLNYSGGVSTVLPIAKPGWIMMPVFFWRRIDSFPIIRLVLLFRSTNREVYQECHRLGLERAALFSWGEYAKQTLAVIQDTAGK